MSADIAPSSLRAFAAACDAAKSTSAKLQKTETLALYLRALAADSPASVPLAARYFAAQPFPPSSGKSLGVGGALVVDVLREITATERSTLVASFRDHGEIGEAISHLWPLDPPSPTLLQIQSHFDRLALTTLPDSKRLILLELLRLANNREAVYLLKIILGDMRIGISDGIVEASIAQAFDQPLARIRKARLLVGDLCAVATLASQNRLHEARFQPFVPLGYMLAQPVETAAAIIDTLAQRPAIAEDKYDGIRAQLHADAFAARTELFSRGSGNVSASFPDVLEPLAAWLSQSPHSLVLDGEIVPLRLRADGQPAMLPFSSLQKRLGRKTITPKLRKTHPAAFIAFDLLYLDGELLLDLPLETRRQKLLQLFESANFLKPPFLLGPSTVVTTAAELETAFTAARTRRNEGLVVKRLDAPYTPGRRGDAWLKLKSHLPTLDVVVVGAERGHGKRRALLSDFTFAVRNDSGELLTIGKAYSGLTDAEIAQLTQRFLDETLDMKGRLHVVRPSVVLEIAFDQITRSDRHTSGFALRFPRIARLRPDKSPADIDTLARVESIYLSPDNLAVGLDESATAADVDQLRLF